MLIKNSVGNNWINDEGDVIRIKTAFQKLGYYKRPVRNGIIDHELDMAIKEFQYDNDLKVDGYMLPDGETEHQIRALSENSNGDTGESDSMPAVPPPTVESEPLENPKILGTNIIDEGIPEQGSSKIHQNDYLRDIDGSLENNNTAIVPNPNIDPGMIIGGKSGRHKKPYR